MNNIKIIECPRDAMQGIKSHFIPTELKASYINMLLKDIRKKKRPSGFHFLFLCSLWTLRSYKAMFIRPNITIQKVYSVNSTRGRSSLCLTLKINSLTPAPISLWIVIGLNSYIAYDTADSGIGSDVKNNTRLKRNISEMKTTITI